jgi:hypothetical protein
MSKPVQDISFSAGQACAGPAPTLNRMGCLMPNFAWLQFVFSDTRVH